MKTPMSLSEKIAEALHFAGLFYGLILEVDDTAGYKMAVDNHALWIKEYKRLKKLESSCN
jgi:hypothetical protein